MKAKKLTSIFLIVAIVLTLGISAVATEVTNGTITITSTKDLTGRSFEAYQLFTVSTTYDVVEAGETKTYYNYVPTPLLKAAVDDVEDTTGWEDADYVEYVRDLDNSTKLSAFSKAVDDAISNGTYAGEPLNIATDGMSASTGDVSYGYYIIFERTDDQTLGEGVTPMVFALDTTTATFAIKSTYESFEKTVRDENGVQIVNSNYAVGQTVYYTLEAEYPNIHEGTTAAWHEFSDNLSTGLDFNLSSLKIKIDTGEYDLSDLDNLPTGVTVTPATNGFELTIDYLTFVDKYKEGDSVVVSYTAKVTTDAVEVYGEPLNNKATLDFANNPLANGMTKEQNVYTFGFDFLKKNPGGDLLAGAQFELSDEDEKVLTFSEVTDGVPGCYVLDPDGIDTITSDDDGVVDIYGLAAGTYYLEETISPSGYNLLDGVIKVVITATEDVDGDLTGGCTVAYYDEDGNVISEEDGSLLVVNYSGIELPSTGGIGTIMFGIFGCLIIVGGATGITMLIIKLKRRHVTSR